MSDTELCQSCNEPIHSIGKDDWAHRDGARECFMGHSTKAWPKPDKPSASAREQDKAEVVIKSNEYCELQWAGLSLKQGELWERPDFEGLCKQFNEALEAFAAHSQQAEKKAQKYGYRLTGDDETMHEALVNEQNELNTRTFAEQMVRCFRTRDDVDFVALSDEVEKILVLAIEAKEARISELREALNKVRDYYGTYFWHYTVGSPDKHGDMHEVPQSHFTGLGKIIDEVSAIWAAKEQG